MKTQNQNHAPESLLTDKNVGNDVAKLSAQHALHQLFHGTGRIAKLKEGMKPMGSLKKTRSMIPRKTKMLLDF